MSNKRERRLRKQAEREEKRRREVEAGLVTVVPFVPRNKRKSTPNMKSEFKTVEEEDNARKEALENQVRVFRRLLPGILKSLSFIKDPRRKGSVKYKMKELMLYGILMFVHQMESRRKANDTMTMPAFVETMTALFPEIKGTPHADTLANILEKMDVDKLEDVTIGLLKDLIRKKKFKRYIQNGRYVIAIDGSGKYSRDWQFAKECLYRKSGESEKYFVYVLEAALVLGNGVTLPFMSEFLSNDEYDFQDSAQKQDCELKAFKRLATRMKNNFPGLKITLVLDGLYPNGPVFTLCRKNKWDFMITLKDGSLKELWEDAKGIMKLEPGNELIQDYGDRRQEFRWANLIEYSYSRKNQHGTQVTVTEKVNVVVCNENWVEHTMEGEINKTTKFAWVSAKALTMGNVHKRCNLTGRFRWFIENNVLQTEKCRGYHYEHNYSYDWNAMKGFHHLMHIAHMLNNLAMITEYLYDYVQKHGFMNTLNFLHDTWKGNWIDKKYAGEFIKTDNCQIRFAF